MALPGLCLLLSRSMFTAQFAWACARTCGSFGEDGGWVFRIAPGHRRADLASGPSGVQLEPVNDQQVFPAARRNC